jgi:hypothetical protein
MTRLYTLKGQRGRAVLCQDCGCDTIRTNNWYMVRDSVWLRAMPCRAGILCIPCLEWRLGQPLVPARFQIHPGRAAANGPRVAPSSESASGQLPQLHPINAVGNHDLGVLAIAGIA